MSLMTAGALTDSGSPFSTCMSRAYGLIDYFVLAPATLADTIVDESRRHILLSGVECALHTFHYPSPPVLVQYGDARRQLFAGVWVDMRAHFRCAYMWWPCVHRGACTVWEPVLNK
jgi:hypothetical protein